MLGFKRDGFAIRLLSLTVILVISNMQLTILKNQVLMDILAEGEDTHVDRTRKLKSYQQVLMYIQYAAYTSLPVGLLAVIFFLVVDDPSFLGLVTMVTTVIVLNRHANEFWKQSSTTIGILAQSSVFLIYMLDFFIFVAAEYLEQPDLVEEDRSKYDFFYNVVRANLEHFNREDKFFYEIFWLYLIIAVCFVQRRSTRYEALFQITMPQKPKPPAVESEPTEQAIVIEDADGTPRDDKDREVDPSDYQRAKAVYEFEEPIRNCFWFKAEVASVCMYNYGVTATMIMTVVAIFIKLNITSVVYLAVLFNIYTVQFYPSRFISKIDDPSFKQKKVKVDSSLGSLIALTSVFILVEYFLYTLHDFSRAATMEEEPVRVTLIATWESFVKDSLCYMEERPDASNADDPHDTCLDDWNDWLSIGRGSIKPQFFLVQYVLLMVAYYTRYFTKNEVHNTGVKILPEPVSGDKHDFTEPLMTCHEREQGADQDLPDDQHSIPTYIRKIYSALQKNHHWVLFSKFPYLLLTFIFLSLTHFNNSGFSDLIACGFLMQTFYFVAFFRSLYTRNVRMLGTLRTYNYVVLAVWVVFQAPFFLCAGSPESSPAAPAGTPARSYYIPANECTRDQVERGSHDETLLSLYIVVAQSIGLPKFARSGVPLSFVLIILTTEIQNWAFHHPYFRAYVLQRMKNEKLDGRMRGFMHVERFHLNRKWAYKAIRQ